MFSLIITIISIALVAALALATLYYGGDAFTAGQSKAQAAKIMTQGEQLLGAAHLFNISEGRWPANMEELTLNGVYLKTAPVADMRAPVSTAFANNAIWKMPLAVDGSPVFVLESVPDAHTCKLVNSMGSLQKMAILKQAFNTLKSQCYGVGPSAFLVVFRVGQTLEGGLPAADLSTAAIPPTDPLAQEWSFAPAAPATPPPSAAPLSLFYQSTDVTNGSFYSPIPLLVRRSVTGVQTAFNSNLESAMRLSISNTGSLPVFIDSISGTRAAVVIDSTTCGAELAVAAVCDVVFHLEATNRRDSNTGLFTDTDNQVFENFQVGYHTGTSSPEVITATVVFDYKRPLYVNDGVFLFEGALRAGMEYTRQYTIVNNSNIQETLQIEVFNGLSVAALSPACQGGVIAANAQCVIELRYTPTFSDVFGPFNSPGNSTLLDGNFSIGIPRLDVVEQRSVYGAVHALLGPYRTEFGSVPQGSSVQQTLNFVNDAAVPMTGLSASIVSLNSPGFDEGWSIVSNDCPATMPAGASCNVIVELTAVRGGHFDANIVFNWDGKRVLGDRNTNYFILHGYGA